MLRVGLAGFGFMGRMHERAWRSVPGARVAAICEKQLHRVREEARGGNLAGADRPVDLEGVELYDDLDAMFASGALDAVSVTLPTHLHAPASIRAMEAGLHVLCEKPMARGLEECDRMIETARRTGRRLQIGHCIRFWPEYEEARRILAGGRYGRPLAASFRRLSGAPAWGASSWFADERLSGGMALDLHIHDTDFILWLFGAPRSVRSATDPGRSYMVTRYEYEGLPVTAEASWGLIPPLGFEMSFLILLEGATLVYESARSPSLRIARAEGGLLVPELPAGDGYSREIRHFARALRGEPVEEVLTPEESRETVRVVLAEMESARRGTGIPVGKGTE